MANTFEISNTYLKQIEDYQDETISLIKILESSQNLLFRLYLARRSSNKVGFFEEEIFPFIKVKYYVGNGRFILFDLNTYKEGYHIEEKLEDNYICSSSVLSLLDDTIVLLNHDALQESLDSYPTFTDWFKRLLDKLPSSEREKISLTGVKIKKFQEVLQEEKKKIAEEEKVSSPILQETKKEEIKQEEKLPEVKEKKLEKVKHQNKPKTTKPLVKTVSYSLNDELEEKKLIEMQNKAVELEKRIKKRVGIHFGWEEIFVYGENSDEMLTLIDKKVRKNGLRKQDDDWILVATYTVDDEDFLNIKEHYPNHAFRSDDILHKPSPEFVAKAIVIFPKKRETYDYGVKKVNSKAVSFANVGPEKGYSVDNDLIDDEGTETSKPKNNNGIIRKVKYKGAIFNNYIEPAKPIIPDDDIETAGSFYNDNGEYGIEEKYEEEEIIVPKHWKCPFCPSKNPWHTEEPARIIEKADGNHIFLCKKHKNSKIS